MSTVSTSPDAGVTARRHLPPAPIFIGLVYVLASLSSVVFMGVVVLAGLDPGGDDSPRQMMMEIGSFGLAALLLGVIPGAFLARSTASSKVGAIVYGALSIITLVFFWSGAPAVLGAVAAWLGGLTRGRPRSTGAARIFAIVGLCIAILNCVTTVGGLTADIVFRIM